jgi:toxin ParE1/3/4
MSLQIRRSDWFVADLEHYAAWYQQEAGWAPADRYLQAVNAALLRLAEMPGIGQLTHFPNPILRGLRYLPAERPFEKHLIFYRHGDSALYIERAVHGARDLPKRLAEPPTL